MNKRITSLLLCLVMIVSLLVTAVPVFAAGSVKFTMTSDKAKASPGDTITYTVTMGEVSRFDSLKYKLSIPEGLTFVAGSGKLADNLKETLNCVDTAWTESTKVFYITLCSDGIGYTSTTPTELMTFQCKVDDGATGSLKIEFIIEPNNCYDSDYDNIAFTTETPSITITAAPKPATGISLNKSELTLIDGSSEQLIATVEPADTTDAVLWISDKPAIAAVNNSGLVTAIAPGEATITATAGTKTATCTVQVSCAHGSFTPVPAQDSNCTENGWDAYKKCDFCGKLFDMNDNPLDGIPYSDTNDDHDFITDTWGYSDADGHAHVCSRNAAHHDAVVPHTAGPAATETTPQTCTECGYVIQAATGHVHAGNLTKMNRQEATCTVDGNKEYYECTCGKFFEDATANAEITDHNSVVLPKTGHSYTVKNSDEAHRRSVAADCRESDTYWYTCANDANHSAKDDPAAADKFYNGEQGAHAYGTEWIDRGEAGHAHKCQYHDAYDAVQPHTPDHEGGATYEYAVKCTDCGRVLEPQRERGSIRVEVPFKLTVKKTGEMAPGKETFKFVVERFGAPVEYVLVQDTVETEGEKTYEGKFIFTISEDQAGNLSEGFVIRQVKGNAEGWTYDETKFYAIPLFVDSYESVRGWSFLKFDQNDEPEYNNPIEEIGFTNSYNAKKSETPPAPQKPEPPKTGDSSMTGLWIALLFVSGASLTGTALYSRKKRAKNR